MLTERIELTNSEKDIVRLKAWLGELCVRHNIAYKTSFNMELVLEEAFTNVISYAYDKNEEQIFYISLSMRPNDISITLEDEGKAFNPLEFESPVQPKTIEEAPAQGMGIHLIRSYTKKLEYKREGAKNVLLMVFDW